MMQENMRNEEFHSQVSSKSGITGLHLGCICVMNIRCLSKESENLNVETVLKKQKLVLYHFSLVISFCLSHLLEREIIRSR